MKRVVVVGGGITGLAATHALAANGAEVALIERSATLGGNLQTERVGGFLIDTGPDSWIANKPAATLLARALGLEDDIIGTIEANRRVYVAWGDELHPLPEGLVLAIPTRILPMVRTKLFSWPGKIRMGLEPFVPRGRLAGDEDESIADFVVRRLGKEATERLAAPLLGGIYAGDAKQLSVRAALPQLVEAERKHGSLVLAMRAQRRAAGGAKGATGASRPPSAFLSLRHGMGQLVEALKRALPQGSARLGRSVKSVALQGSDARGRYAVQLDAGDTLFADDVLFAVPAHVARRLLRPLDAELCDLLDGIPHASTAAVFLGFRRDDVAHALDATGYIVPRGAGTEVLASTWVSSKWEGRAPEGKVLLRVFFGGVGGEGVLEQDDEGLVRLARDEVARRIGAKGEPLLAKTYRFTLASPQPLVGHLGRMRRVRERLALLPGLHLAGGGYDGIGIPSCIEQGQQAAKAIAGS